MKVLYRTISELQSTHTEGFFIVAEDFNQANLKSVLPHFHQRVDCATRGVNMLDIDHRPYTTMKDAFGAAPSPHLGSSDHLSVVLIPAYKPLLVRGKPTVRQVRVWSEGTMEAQQDCFECTDWDMFKAAATYNNHINIDEYVMSVSAYINKCMEDVSASKSITARANQKPWMTDEVLKMLKARNSAFKSFERRDGTENSRSQLELCHQTSKVCSQSNNPRLFQ